MTEYRDEIIERLAVAHRSVMAVGRARIDADPKRLLAEIDRAMAALVAVGELLEGEQS